MQREAPPIRVHRRNRGEHRGQLSRASLIRRQKRLRVTCTVDARLDTACARGCNKNINYASAQAPTAVHPGAGLGDDLYAAEPELLLRRVGVKPGMAVEFHPVRATLIRDRSSRQPKESTASEARRRVSGEIMVMPALDMNASCASRTTRWSATRSTSGTRSRSS